MRAATPAIDARTIGSVWLLDQLWRRLDVAAAVRAATDVRRFTTNMERVLFALAANRAHVHAGSALVDAPLVPCALRVPRGRPGWSLRIDGGFPGVGDSTSSWEPSAFRSPYPWTA
jgi:hypothetical protein